MKKFFLLLMVVPNTFILTAQNKEAEGKADYVKTELLVKFKKKVPTISVNSENEKIKTTIEALDRLNKLYTCKSIDYLYSGSNLNEELQRSFVFTFKNEVDIDAAIDAYLATGYFEYVQPNHIGQQDGVQDVNGIQDVNFTPNEPADKFKLQWGLYNDATFTYANGTVPKSGADINIKPAWDITTGDPNTIVAVIDGGINLTHPEFSGRIWTNTKEIAGNNVDDDGNGYKDDVNGWNFSANSNNVSDNSGHGTNVTSIIGATGNNSQGWAGVNWKCKLMIISNGSGSFSESVIINAIKYAADNGAKVVNMSLGFTNVPSSVAMQDAVNYAYNKGVLLIASMGNNNTANPQIPASCTNVMAVGATNVNDARCVPFGTGGTGAAGSNFGSYISVVAPGNWIVGCVKTGATENYSVYNSYNGTSQSTPYVTGLASLIYALNPNFTPAQVRSFIETTAKDQVGSPTEDVAGWDKYMGWGRIDAYQAIIKAQASVGIKETGWNKAAITFFPNPFSDRAMLKISKALTDESQLKTVVITDILGNTVQTIQTYSHEIPVKRENLSNGLYFYQVMVEGKSLITDKFILVSQEK